MSITLAHQMTLNECKNFLRFPWQKYASSEIIWINFADAGAEHPGNDECWMALADKISQDSVSVLLEGYATAEIAEFLQVPNGTVRTRLARGREQLKKMLKEAE